jgi:hypothetical protein
VTPPKPLVLFLAFCGGTALFMAPILAGAVLLGATDDAEPSAQGSQPAAEVSAEPSILHDAAGSAPEPTKLSGRA